MLVIGQCNRTAKGTVNMSCLYEWTECIKRMCCCLAFCQLSCCSFFYKNIKLMSCFFLKFCHSFDWLVTGLQVVQFCLWSYSWLTNWTPALLSSNFVNHLYDYRLNWTPLGPITIMNWSPLSSITIKNKGYTNGIYGGQFSSKISKTKLWKEQNKYK